MKLKNYRLSPSILAPRNLDKVKKLRKKKRRRLKSRNKNSCEGRYGRLITDCINLYSEFQMEELNELKNLVMQNLEKNGYLSNIRAQIRSSVFKTIDSQEGSSKKVHCILLRPLLSTVKTSRFKNWQKAVKDKTLSNSFRSFFNVMKWSILSRSSLQSQT